MCSIKLCNGSVPVVTEMHRWRKVYIGFNASPHLCSTICNIFHAPEVCRGLRIIAYLPVRSPLSDEVPVCALVH